MVTVDSASIMKLMIRKNIGTYELAHRAGVTAATLLRVLEGQKLTKIMTVFKIAQALNVDHKDLIEELATDK